MNYKEAIEWLQGKRSGNNFFQQPDTFKWEKDVAEYDAYMMQQAYWIVKAHHEGLVKFEHTDDVKKNGGQNNESNG